MRNQWTTINHRYISGHIGIITELRWIPLQKTIIWVTSAEVNQLQCFWVHFETTLADSKNMLGIPDSSRPPNSELPMQLFFRPRENYINVIWYYLVFKSNSDSDFWSNKWLIGSISCRENRVRWKKNYPIIRPSNHPPRILVPRKKHVLLRFTCLKPMHFTSCKSPLRRYFPWRLYEKAPQHHYNHLLQLTAELFDTTRRLSWEKFGSKMKTNNKQKLVWAFQIILRKAPGT